jgi:hypothetical protein
MRSEFAGSQRRLATYLYSFMGVAIARRHTDENKDDDMGKRGHSE